MTPRTLLLVLLLAAVLPGCSPESTGPDAELAGSDITAIHIARGGVPVDTLIHAGSLGSMTFELLLESRDGTLHPAIDTRVAWGSTHPSVLDQSSASGGQVFVFRHQNGRARLVAQVGELRDSVAVDVRQVVVSARVRADTMVTLTLGARDLEGRPFITNRFRFIAEPVDSNGYRVAATERIEHFPLGAAPFGIAPTQRGDTLFITGHEARDGLLATRFAGRTDTVAVQVADRFHVLWLDYADDRTLEPLPRAITIPRGTAIVFINATDLIANFGEPTRAADAWRAGPVGPGQFEAQTFRSPGVYEVWWGGKRCLITVT